MNRIVKSFVHSSPEKGEIMIKQTPVGSLPRSPKLQEAYNAFDDGNLKKAELDKLIDVIDIQNFSDNESVGRELVMIKVKANSSNRSEVTQICDVFRGKIIDVAKESLVVEATGNGNKIVAFIELIEPFGIIELARTGTVSLRRGRADH